MGTDGAKEEKLLGGDMTDVVRVGETVRRAAGPWTPSVHALLRHLRDHGFDKAPEPLGIDSDGREVLTFLPGETPRYPLPAFVFADRTLTDIAKLLRDYHDAAAAFRPIPEARWQWPSHEPFEVICHNDFAPYNIVFEGPKPVGVIDFDTASPGSRAWDMAYAAYRFVPLAAPANPDAPSLPISAQARRLRLFCTAYRAGGPSPGQVLEAAVSRLTELVGFIEESADAGDEVQQKVLERGDTRTYEEDIAYITENRQGLLD